jgi:hypothetical protein
MSSNRSFKTCIRSTSQSKIPSLKVSFKIYMKYQFTRIEARKGILRGSNGNNASVD